MANTAYAFKGDDKFRTLRNVMNPEIEKLINQIMSDYTQSRSANDADIARWQGAYMANQGEADARAAQEAGAVGRYYDGSLAGELAGIRNRRKQARMAAGERAIGEALRQRSGARLLEDASGGSYFDRLALKQNRDILTDAMLEDSALERQDLGFLEQGRMNLLGRRNDLVDQATSRRLMPQSVRNAELARRFGLVTSLGEQDRANTKYGLQKIRSWLDTWRDAQSGFVQDVNDVASVTSSIYGMAGMGGMGGGGGGGGSKQPTNYSYWGGWQGMNSQPISSGMSYDLN